MKGKIVKVTFEKNKKTAINFTVIASSLNRKEIKYLKNTDKESSAAPFNEQDNFTTSKKVSSLVAEEEPAGEQTLPDVVVTGYVYDDPSPYYW